MASVMPNLALSESTHRGRAQPCPDTTATPSRSSARSFYLQKEKNSHETHLLYTRSNQDSLHERIRGDQSPTPHGTKLTIKKRPLVEGEDRVGVRQSTLALNHFLPLPPLQFFPCACELEVLIPEDFCSFHQFPAALLAIPAKSKGSLHCKHKNTQMRDCSAVIQNLIPEATLKVVHTTQRGNICR